MSGAMVAAFLWTDAESSPHGVDQACDRINETTTNNEQDHPYQIIDLLLEFGESPRCLLRPPHKDGSQQENGRHGSHNDDDELVHRVTRLFRRQPRNEPRKATKLPLDRKFSLSSL
jgi:hypothetical protein